MGIIMSVGRLPFQKYLVLAITVDITDRSIIRGEGISRPKTMTPRARNFRGILKKPTGGSAGGGAKPGILRTLHPPNPEANPGANPPQTLSVLLSHLARPP